MNALRPLRERLRQSLWFIPALFAAAAIGLALVSVAIDRQLERTGVVDGVAFGGTAEGARALLSTVAESMLTFTALVFTITMLVLQLASSQLSPRVMRTFLRDRNNQAVLGLFVATFLFTLVVLQSVRSPDDGQGPFVPGLSVGAAFVLLLASVAAFVYYIDHMAHAIRATSVIESIARETRDAIDELYPEAVGHGAREAPPVAVPVESPAHEVDAPRAGVITEVDEGALRRAVGLGDGDEDDDGDDGDVPSDRFLQLVPSVGDHVAEGAPLYRLWGTWDEGARDRLERALSFAAERTVDQDAAFGFRQLVDVAVRALSPGTNDPTTAVQALDRLHDLLRRLALRDIPASVRAGRDGRPRLLVARPDWDGYVALAFDEIRISGAGQIQVVRRMRSILRDLLSVAPPERQAALRRSLELIERAAQRALGDAEVALVLSER